MTRRVGRAKNKKQLRVFDKCLKLSLSVLLTLHRRTPNDQLQILNELILRIQAGSQNRLFIVLNPWEFKSPYMDVTLLNSRFSEFPQDIILQLQGGIYQISLLEILCHEFKIPTSVEIYFGGLLDPTKPYSETNSFFSFLGFDLFCFLWLFSNCFWPIHSF